MSAETTGARRRLLGIVAAALAAQGTFHLAVMAPKPPLAVLIFPGVVAALLAILPAVVAALLAQRSRDAAWTAAAGCALGLGAGLATMPLASRGSLVSMMALGAALAAVFSALLTTWVVHRSRRAADVVVWVTLAAVVLGSVWACLLGARTVGRFPVPGGRATVQLESPGSTDDEALYLRAHVLMTRDGLGYYDAVRTGSRQLAPMLKRDTVSALNFRQPWLLRLWALVSGAPGSGIAALFMAFAALASVSAYAFAARFVRRAFALIAAAIVGVSYARASGTNLMLGSEHWAAALALASLTCAVWVDRPPRRIPAGAFGWTAAALALGAVLLRELAVFALLAGLIASLSTPERRAARGWVPWASAFAAFIALYGWHVVATGAGFSAGAGEGWRWFDAVRPLHVFTRGQEWVFGYPWTGLVVVVLGVLGVASVGPEHRVHVAVALVAPTVLFALAGPAGYSQYSADVARMWGPLAKAIIGEGGRVAPDYWGATVVPLLQAASPLGLALVFPEALRPRD